MSGTGIVASIGITTGRMYAALVGTDNRSEYACVGTCVNTAARLMGLADGRILVDEHTFKPAEKDIRFSQPQQVQLKNIKHPQTVYVIQSASPLPPLPLHRSCLSRHHSPLTTHQLLPLGAS